MPWRGGFKIFLLLAGLTVAVAAGAAERSVLIDDFEDNLRPEWEVKEFKGRTVYLVAHDNDGSHVLKAESRDAASGLIFKMEYSLRDYPFLAWRWKVANILDKGDETKKEGDDYPARVYVVFPHWFFPKTKSINYIWANKLPRGKHVPNPFTGNAVMVAVQSGRKNVGRWISERRNVYEDYRLLFGEEPPRVGAIAIMTDTDNTGGSATAWYDDIRIER
ncbi:MAG TPA: DUF3047 domain-containing protein [Desulfuromonadales bacterium]|nr:DUF3047 domain-containing protein [Desulfuromonadales bacterium]